VPTADEWEYAARGDEKLLFPWGNEEFRGAANIDSIRSFNRRLEVGVYPKDKSPFGLMDMAGNVSEWVIFRSSDGVSYPASKGLAFNKTWSRPYSLLCFRPMPRNVGHRSRDLGFRCAK